MSICQGIRTQDRQTHPFLVWPHTGVKHCYLVLRVATDLSSSLSSSISSPPPLLSALLPLILPLPHPLLVFAVVSCTDEMHKSLTCGWPSRSDRVPC